MKDNKQTVQYIVLGVLLAVCVGVVTVMLLPKKQGPPPSPTAAAKTPPAAAKPVELADVPEPPVGAGPSQPDSVLAETADMSMSARRDPFAPAMDVTDHLLMIKPPSEPFKLRNTHMAKIPSLSGWQSSSHLGAGYGKLPVTPVLPDGQAPTPPAEQKAAFVLTGVITGETNVAIIRMNEKRYIVREGQMIDNTYLVVKVTGKSVTLARGGQDIVLELGG